MPQDFFRCIFFVNKRQPGEDSNLREYEEARSALFELVKKGAGFLYPAEPPPPPRTRGEQQRQFKKGARCFGAVLSVEQVAESVIWSALFSLQAKRALKHGNRKEM